jgi:hypothetical protein
MGHVSVKQLSKFLRKRLMLSRSSLEALAFKEPPPPPPAPHHLTVPGSGSAATPAATDSQPSLKRKRSKTPSTAGTATTTPSASTSASPSAATLPPPIDPARPTLHILSDFITHKRKWVTDEAAKLARREAARERFEETVRRKREMDGKKEEARRGTWF